MTRYDGTWEYSGGNGMQVSMDITWSAVTNASTSVTATYKIYTDNQYTYADTQTMSYSVKNGATTVDSGSFSYNNNDGTSEVLRTTQTYTYTYGSTSYGTSPATLGFAASVSGTYNGVTPSVSASVAVPARPIAAPAAPVLTATTASSSSINLSWTAPDNNGGAITDYTLQASSTSATTGFATIGPSGASTARTYTYTGLSKYNQYWFRVSAINSAGASGYSTVKTATTDATVPDTVTGLTATPDVSSVVLSWTALSASTGGIGLDLATDYVVKRGATTLGYTGSATTFTDTGVSPATAYTYTVAGINSIGTGTADTVSTTTIGGIIHVWNGSNWTTWSGLPQVWNGSNWTTWTGNARVWNGTEWKYGI